MKRKITFYGDSNTFGFDPRGFFGGRYPHESLWTTLVSKELGESFETENEGLCGRQLPDNLSEYSYISVLLDKLSKDDLFVIMLGINDLLHTLTPDAAKPIRRMDGLLEWLISKEDRPRILVIAPPYVDEQNATDDFLKILRKESLRMNEGFRESSDRYGVDFCDASGWGVEFAFDKIHFSEEGNASFAKGLLPVLNSIL